MAQRLQITYADGRDVTVTVTPRGEVAFEDEFDLSVVQANSRNKYVYWLAWKLLEIDGQETRSFEAFIADIAAVEIAGGEEKAGPTRKTPRRADLSASA